MSTTPHRHHHDMGGLPAGKVEPTEHDYAEWERRVDALSMIMGRKGITVDERRKHIEMIPPQAFGTMNRHGGDNLNESVITVERDTFRTVTAFFHDFQVFESCGINTHPVGHFQNFLCCFIASFGENIRCAKCSSKFLASRVSAQSNNALCP